MADSIIDSIITGFHAIEESLRSCHKGFLYYSGSPGPRVKKILNQGLASGIICIQKSEDELDLMVKKLPEYLQNHRGIVFVQNAPQTGAPQNMLDLDSFLADFEAQTSERSNKRSIVAILDSISDVHNVGAILRSADQFGVDIVLLPKDSSVHEITENVVIQRASSGAASWVKFCVVSNLCAAAEKLKKAGFWIYGADTKGENIRTVDFAPKSAIVLGSEGSGISRLLKTKCDIIVTIPSEGKVDSLNVSVAAGIFFYQMSQPVE